MSNLGSMFLQMAGRYGKGTTDAPAPVEQKPDVSLKLCQGDCLEHTVHIRRQGYWECSLCQNRIYDKSAQAAS